MKEQCLEEYNVVKANSGKIWAQEQKYDLGQFMKFLPADRAKSDVFSANYPNAVLP